MKGRYHKINFDKIFNRSYNIFLIDIFIYPTNPPSITNPPSQGSKRTDIGFRGSSHSSLEYKDLDKLAREI